ncbi:unnamed protein product [Allacma fusca]|uniref:Secreted protein n=1 Tax=Allacma fusca TaxID=39272 RepID=A0A8J2MCP6_9HEXA|nr:unnamed protein product [Allacma fusca]
MSYKIVFGLTVIFLLSFPGIFGAPGPFLWWGHSDSTYNRPRPPLVGAHAHGHGSMHSIHHVHQHVSPVVRPLQPGGHIHRYFN